MSDDKLIQVPTAFVIHVDVICSLVAYLYGKRLPEDITGELAKLSSQARGMYRGHPR